MALALFIPSWHLDKSNKGGKYSKQQDICLTAFPVSSALQQKINVSRDLKLWLKKPVDFEKQLCS